MKVRKDIILWGNFIGFIVMGMIVLSFGAIMPYIRDTYNLSYEQGGRIFALLASSSLIMGFFGGALSDRFGYKSILLLANFFYVIGLVIIAYSHTPLMLYIGAFIVGAGWGSCNTSVNMIVSIYVHGDGKIMSLLHMIYGVGAVAIPVISGIMIKSGLAWNSIMIMLAVLSLLNIIIVVKMPIHKMNNNTVKHKGENKNVFSNYRLYVFIGIIFFYTGAENTFNGWLVTYLRDGLNFSERFSQNMLSFMWVVMIFGRYLNSILSQIIKKETIILLSGIGGLLSVILFINVKSTLLIIIAIALTSIMMSGVYPITIANANPIIKRSGTAAAMIMSSGGLGAAVVPYIGGNAAGKVGVTGIIMTIIVSFALLTIMALINRKVTEGGE